MLMKAEQRWFPSGVLIAKDTSNREKNDMNLGTPTSKFPGVTSASIYIWEYF